MANYGITPTAAPASEPLTTQELKDWCRITVSSTAQDAVIAANGVAARELCEKLLGRQFVTASYLLTLPGFPWPGGWQSLETPSLYPDPHTIRVPKAPLQSVQSITYYDLSNNLQTLDPSVYVVDATQDPGVICLDQNLVWPVTRYRPAAVRVAFTAGYGDATAVPESIKHAIRFAVALWLENRGEDAGVMTALPRAAERLLYSQWNGALEYGLP